MTGDSRAAGEQLRKHMLGAEAGMSTAEGAFGFLDDFIVEHIFGELWQREGLDLKTRSLCTIATLVAAKMPDATLRYHIIGALANGATETEIREVIVHTGVYAGLGVVVSARPVAEAVFSSRRGT